MGFEPRKKRRIKCKTNHEKAARNLGYHFGSTPRLRLPVQNFACRLLGNNKGMWQIDHIIPCWFFAHYDRQAMRECWHWTNLRPLWLSQNKKKSGKIQHIWHVPFSVRKTWIPSETFIGTDGLTHHNGELSQESL